jgi:demethylmenaquinone methyltransferase/2-methoxy-6-polyprenyl-1,4-benzoquinol methylase
MALKAPPAPDQVYIRTMFDSFASRYDTFSWLIGLGQAGRMRRRTLRHLRPGMRVLDLAAGTGDLAVEAALRVGGAGEVVALDFSEPMLKYARRKFMERTAIAAHGAFRTECRSAEDLPLKGEKFDSIVSGYALRNMYRNIGSILEGVYASLKPGGQIAFLDLTEPPDPLRRFLFRAYLYVFVGIYGLALFGKNYPVSYLPDSASRFFKAKDFAKLLIEAGFENVRLRPFMLGAATLYRAQRPL